jgi:hypothetical protein
LATGCTHREIAVVAPSRLPALVQESAINYNTVEDGHPAVAKGPIDKVVVRHRLPSSSSESEDVELRDEPFDAPVTASLYQGFLVVSDAERRAKFLLGDVAKVRVLYRVPGPDRRGAVALAVLGGVVSAAGFAVMSTGLRHPMSPSDMAPIEAGATMVGVGVGMFIPGIIFAMPARVRPRPRAPEGDARLELSPSGPRVAF